MNNNKKIKDINKTIGIILGIVLSIIIGGIVTYCIINNNDYVINKKPILYLYPTEKTKVRITFDNSNNITTSYPKYDREWNVNVDSDGTIYYNGREYYALYWEENYNRKVRFDEGFYVTSDNAIDFLEEKLSIIGLNEKESNEFIMYWLPILERNEKSIVYFELTDAKQEYNELIIDPKPDSLLRITMHVKKVNNKISLKEQVLPTFERKGFTAVEWGGIEY